MRHEPVSRPMRISTPMRSARPDAWGHRWRVVAVSAAIAVSMPALAGCGGDASAEASSPGVDKAAIDRIVSAAAVASASSAAAAKSGPGTSASASGAGAEASASSTGAAGASATDFVVPDAAKAHTHEGAKAFVQFYWEMLGKVDAHPQTGVIERFAAPSCTSCARQEENLAYLVRSKAVVVTKNAASGPYSVRSDSTRDAVIVQFTYSDAGTSHVQGGRSIETFPAMNTLTETRADWTSEGWRVGAIGNVAGK